jgi:hypothetical protein
VWQTTTFTKPLVDGALHLVPPFNLDPLTFASNPLDWNTTTVKITSAPTKDVVSDITGLPKILTWQEMAKMKPEELMKWTEDYIKEAQAYIEKTNAPSPVIKEPAPAPAKKARSAKKAKSTKRTKAK